MNIEVGRSIDDQEPYVRPDGAFTLDQLRMIGTALKKLADAKESR